MFPFSQASGTEEWEGGQREAQATSTALPSLNSSQMEKKVVSMGAFSFMH